MPTKQQHEQHGQPSADERRGRDELSALIGEQVMHTLGRPWALQRVQVRRLWEAYYRVNVFIGEDLASSKIANSYFVEVDGDGNIVESTPKITKQH